MNVTSALLTILFCGVLFVNGELETRIIQKSDNLLYDEWWQTAVIYQIYPRSFKDSDNDGNGDLQGIIQKLDYLEDTGIDAIWLNPIFTSPQVDGGYDVADYRNIDPIYGTLDDLRQLVDEAHERDIKVLLDYVPNHTSDQHAWFQASLQKDPKYDDYYIWRNATYVDGERRPPNNWISWFSGPAWEWNEDRQQYYFHQFSTGQPDLNYRNPAVVEEMKDVLRYWLDFGVDGFRMDAVITLFEDELLTDEPESGTPGLTPNDHDYLIHNYTIGQPETFDMIYQWRDILDEFNKQNGSYTRIMITEGNADPDIISLLYGSDDHSRLGAHYSFNFITFSGLRTGFDDFDLFYSIQDWLNIRPYTDTIYKDNWLLGNHDSWRVATRLGVENIDALNILVSILPGVQITYQGEEIGQENGFNNGAKPWLPVSGKHVETNLARQNVPDINSHYNVYKEMLKVRQEFKNITYDEFTMIATPTPNVLFFRRSTGDVIYVGNYNLGDAEILGNMNCTDCTVVARSINSDYAAGDIYNMSQPLKPKETVLVKVPPQSEANIQK